MKFNTKGYSKEELVDFYRSILFPRMIEEKMLVLLRQGKISKWFSGIGQEAIAVGVTKALQESDYIMPLHRNLGVWTSRNIPFEKLFMQWQGKKAGFTKGRDRSFHFGTPEYKIIGMISHLGAMLPVADGISLASNLDGEDYISVAFSGDGGASEGDFHEAINVASVWDLPVIFLVENNGYGLSTPSREQFNCEYFVDKAKGYGIEGVQVDGNNILEVHRVVSEIAKKMRKDRKPVILEAMTFRMRGHEEASGTKYVPKELFDEWGKKDPISNYENFLLEEGILTEDLIAEIRKENKEIIEKGIQAGMDEPELVPDLTEEMRGVFSQESFVVSEPDVSTQREIRFVDAISEGLRQAFEKDDHLVLMGQDVAEYGGVFKISQGFTDLFTTDRIRNTPICESAILGAALGLSIRGRASVVEMQFSDFVSCGFNQIVNNLAKTHYRWGQEVNVTVRMPTGGGVAAGPFHSQSTEGWFLKTAGLKVVYPSNPYDAKGLLTSAILEPNPVLFFEHKALYRSISGEVPEGYYNLPLGKAAVARSGEDITVITYGMGVHWATQLADDCPEHSIEIIDLRTLAPLDTDTMYASVRKTGKCLILHEDTLTMGLGAELASLITEHCFESLDGPVKRVGALDTPVPFHAQLEQQFMPTHRFKKAILDLLAY